MSYCEQLSVGNPINPCAGNLRVGALSDEPGGSAVVEVRFENLATGRVQSTVVTPSELAVFVPMPGDLSPGQMYGVTVHVDGTSVAFYPYAFDGSAYAVGVVATFGVAVKVARVFGVDGPSSDYLTLQ